MNIMLHIYLYIDIDIYVCICTYYMYKCSWRRGHVIDPIVTCTNIFMCTFNYFTTVKFLYLE